jgi:hypothetical protein
MNIELKPIYCGITDFHMYLRNAYENKNDLPESLNQIDSEEVEIINKENDYIKSFCNRKITILKIATTLAGIGATTCFLVDAGFLLHIPYIDTLAKIGIIVGVILGYIAGYVADKYYLASRRLAVFCGGITPNRIDRLEKKLDKIRTMISEINEDNLKQKLIISEKYLEKRLKGKEEYARIREFFFGANQ